MEELKALVAELDGADRYEARRHVAGEHASLLTAAVSMTGPSPSGPSKVNRKRSGVEAVRHRSIAKNDKRIDAINSPVVD